MAGKGSSNKGQLRIIGGMWRGRKLLFEGTDGLRPTPDRVRETLFNWLSADIDGARCLDLFAGSGALVLEALSRGASHCDFVEMQRASIHCIQSHLRALNCDQGVTHCADSGLWLQSFDPQKPYDVAFLDPPFGQSLLPPTCSTLEEKQLLAPTARIYLETSIREDSPSVPAHWEQLREKKAGEVRYQLFVRGA